MSICCSTKTHFFYFPQTYTLFHSIKKQNHSKKTEQQLFSLKITLTCNETQTLKCHKAQHCQQKWNLKSNKLDNLNQIHASITQLVLFVLLSLSLQIFTCQANNGPAGTSEAFFDLSNCLVVVSVYARIKRFYFLILKRVDMIQCQYGGIPEAGEGGV